MKVTLVPEQMMLSPSLETMDMEGTSTGLTVMVPVAVASLHGDRMPEVVMLNEYVPAPVGVPLNVNVFAC